ncbi:radical SAM protein [Zhenpiania hominis]|uniref:radical SAM protein n=1 Tax=Zhenpiania hominis TaxID=2763644 RepID=UPI0039F55C94
MSTAYIAINYECNQKCRFCPCSQRARKYEYLRLEDLKEVINELVNRDKIKHIVISGGEPTIHPEFIDIIRYLSLSNLRITILTNSEKFSDRNFSMKFIQQVDVEKVSIITTIHSHYLEKHEYANGTQGSFYRTIEGLKFLDQKGIGLIIKHCITVSNYKDLIQFYDFVDDHFSEDTAIQFCSIDYCGMEKDDLKREMLSFISLKPYLEQVFDYHILRKESGSKRNIYCINMPLCASDPCYWKFIQLRENLTYSFYLAPSKTGLKVDSYTSIDVDTLSKQCNKCKVKSICVGTYRSAFNYFGDKIVKAYV